MSELRCEICKELINDENFVGHKHDCYKFFEVNDDE